MRKRNSYGSQSNLYRSVYGKPVPAPRIVTVLANSRASDSAIMHISAALDYVRQSLDGDIIGLQGVQVEVIDATNVEITFRALNTLSESP